MPLILDEPKVPVEQFKAYSVVHIKEILIDLLSQRIVIVVMHGNIANNQFVKNKNIRDKRYLIEGTAFQQIADSIPAGGQNVYDIIKNIAWNHIISTGAETGTIA